MEVIEYEFRRGDFDGDLGVLYRDVCREVSSIQVDPENENSIATIVSANPYQADYLVGTESWRVSRDVQMGVVKVKRWSARRNYNTDVNTQTNE